MPASSVVLTPTPAPPPPAYPDPIHLPVAPHGNPQAARLLAAAYRTLADQLDHNAGHVTAISLDLSDRWHGHGATALRLPQDTIEHNLHTLAAASRQAAEHLEDYATALHHAQHHHGWSLTKIIAIGAVVTITTAAVIVTVGAAAPIGTLAAAEVGDAIIGAETAAGAATAAETAATEGLTLTGQTISSLRTLTALTLPHLTQGALSTGIDTALHLATGHTISAHELAETFLTATLGSATTSATRSALRSTGTYATAGTATRTALDTTTLTATLTTDTALEQYTTTGHLNPTTLTQNALLTALTGAATTLRHPLDGTSAISRRLGPSKGQSPDDISATPDLVLHEGPGAPYGHTLSKHVAKDRAWLEQRLVDEPWITAASSFSSRSEAEAAVEAAIAQNRSDVAALVAGKRQRLEIRFQLPHTDGMVIPRVVTPPLSPTRTSDHGIVRLKMVHGNVVIITAFLE